MQKYKPILRRNRRDVRNFIRIFYRHIEIVSSICTHFRIRVEGGLGGKFILYLKGNLHVAPVNVTIVSSTMYINGNLLIQIQTSTSEIL
jgi:hypothetical protein